MSEYVDTLEDTFGALALRRLADNVKSSPVDAGIKVRMYLISDAMATNITLALRLLAATIVEEPPSCAATRCGCPRGPTKLSRQANASRGFCVTCGGYWTIPGME